MESERGRVGNDWRRGRLIGDQGVIEYGGVRSDGGEVSLAELLKEVKETHGVFFEFFFLEIPLQRFVAGVISSLSVLSGADPISTHECANGGCVPPPQSGGPSDEERPSSISPIPIHLGAFGLDPSDYTDLPHVTASPPSSIPDLISVSSSSEESVLYPSTPSSPGFSGEYYRLRRAPHWSDVLLERVNFQDYYYLAREEAFISSGESGEQEAVRSTESDATSSDGSEEVLAAETEGVRSGDGTGGVREGVLGSGI